MPVRFYQGEETSPPCAATVLCIRTRLPLSWHRKEGLEMEYVAFTYLFIISFLSSPLYFLIRDSLHFLFYLLVLHFTHLFFSTELFPLGLFSFSFFSWHFWSRKCIKDASSLGWTLKPKAFEGLQGQGGFTWWGGWSVVSGWSGSPGRQGRYCPQHEPEQNRSTLVGAAHPSKKNHHNLPPNHCHHCSASLMGTQVL